MNTPQEKLEYYYKNFKVEKFTGLAEKAYREKKSTNAFMGVSIRNKYFYHKDTMRSILASAGTHFKKFLILLMDYPDRHNISFLKGISLEEATKRAYDQSDTIKCNYEKISNELGLDNVEIVGFRDFMNKDDYKQIDEEVKQIVSTGKRKAMILDVVQENVGTKVKEFLSIRNLPTSDEQTVLNKLSNYIIEEIAPLLYFTELGYPVELDPTKEFVIKRDLYEETVSLKSLTLTDRGHIQFMSSFNDYKKGKNNRQI